MSTCCMLLILANVHQQQASTASIFFHAMAISPLTQRKAQIELDSVIGPARLPTVDDIAFLPYVQAILLEVLRWSPPAPLGVAHRSISDDEYNGYSIPSGTIISAVRVIKFGYAVIH